MGYLKEKSPVIFKIYDVSGRMLKKTIYGKKKAGIYTIKINFNSLSYGVYFIKLETEKFKQVKKVIYLR